MPYISKQEVSVKRLALKKALPDYKLSVRNIDHSTISVAIMKGPHKFEVDESSFSRQVNHYYMKEHFKDDTEGLKILTTIKDIIQENQTELVYDGDYGSVPTFYIRIEIGQWEKPYICTTNEAI